MPGAFCARVIHVYATCRNIRGKGVHMANKQTKYHLSLRVDPVTAQRIEALRGTGETQTSAYNRTLAAGVEALENPREAAQEAGEAETELVKALRAHIDTLTAQLDVKDTQIKNLGDNLRAAQMLHAQAAQHKPLEAGTTSQDGGEHAQDVTAAQERTQAEHAQEPKRRGGIAGAIGRLIWGR